MGNGPSGSLPRAGCFSLLSPASPLSLKVMEAIF
nr:MAG TPA: hypothetical protein [Caudoviricetes sp.]DAQ45557.1 MAG TPA: hypothetical protein [Caudoviricetes sp.]DAT97742.1 MAG TPA: hypothetical protein [Caudoviricetes sp.]DAU70005.1 MAG TPA: hypothetical protein [Caudoviricetes sp.]